MASTIQNVAVIEPLSSSINLSSSSTIAKIKLIVQDFIDRIYLFFQDCVRQIHRTFRTAAPKISPFVLNVSPNETFLSFLKLSPNFSANPYFEKVIRDHFNFPPGSVSIDKNYLTISLGQARSVQLDPNDPLTQEEFLKMNRHTDTKNLLQLPDKCANPLPRQLPPLKLGNLDYFRSFGEIVTGFLQKQKKISFAPEIVLKMDGNLLQFIKGGLINICSIEFLPGWLEEQGVVAISSSMIFWTITRLYFLSDVDWLISKFK